MASLVALSDSVGGEQVEAALAVGGEVVHPRPVRVVLGLGGGELLLGRHCAALRWM